MTMTDKTGSRVCFLRARIPISIRYRKNFKQLSQLHHLRYRLHFWQVGSSGPLRPRRLLRPPELTCYKVNLTLTRVAYITKLLLSIDSKLVTHKNKPLCKKNFEKKYLDSIRAALYRFCTCFLQSGLFLWVTGFESILSKSLVI